MTARSRASALCAALVACLVAAPLLAAAPDAAWRPEPDLQAEPGHESMTDAAAGYEAQSKYAKAARAYRKIANLAKLDENRANALVRQADCEKAAGKLFASYKTYERALEFAVYVPVGRILENLRGTAEAFARGEASLFHVRNPELAAEAYELIRKHAPAGPRAPADALRLAQLQSDAGNTDEAVLTCRELIRRHPGTPEQLSARLLAARLLVRSAEAGDGDGRQTREARDGLEEFLSEAAPADADVAEARTLRTLVRERQAGLLLSLGRFYCNPSHERLPAARRYLSDVLVQYPDTSAKAVAELLLSRLGPAPAAPAPVGPPVPPSAASPTPALPPTAAPAPALTPATPMAPATPTPAATPVVAAGGTGAVAGPAAPAPDARALIQSREGVHKWLLPLEDLKPGESRP